MKKNIAVLKGDGIGPEVVDQALLVLNAVAERFGHKFTYQMASIGGVAIDETGNPLPQETMDICQAADATLLGAIGDPKYDNNPGASIRPEQGLLSLRKNLELFANVRPVKIYSSLKKLSPLKEERIDQVDMIIYRELTSGIYFGEKQEGKEIASDLCQYTRAEIERIAQPAFEAAMNRRQKLCLVDKANVLASSRLWRGVVQDMSDQYPAVQVDYLYVDNAAMQLILNPSQFDVILTSNMFGDILSDAASVLGGSIGLLPSASFGLKNRLYEPIHGSFPQAKGKNIANPVATILSAAMMLRDFGLETEARTIESAVEECLEIGLGTPDITKINSSTCTEVGRALCQLVAGKVYTL